MVKSVGKYEPNYPVPPGLILEEMLEALGMSQAEFARRCGRSPKHISEIIAAKAPVEPDTAIQFERVLGLAANIWLSVEGQHQLHRAKEKEIKTEDRARKWLQRIPINELVARGLFDSPSDTSDCVNKVLSFFSVGSIDAWERRHEELAVTYRHSTAFQSSNEAVYTWLRIGVLNAERQECDDFNKSRFKGALKEIRSLTVLEPKDFVPRMTYLCNKAGVAFTVVRPLPETALSGAAWWKTPRLAIIQQSLRHLSNDHFWFTFFHEAAHILLHDKKNRFIDENAVKSETDFEREANRWAIDFLIPELDWNRFVAAMPRSKVAVETFARTQGIAPGIVVGRLQHDGIIPWTHLNGLKQRYQ